MKEIIEKRNKDAITSLELVNQINLFRSKDGNKNELRHDNLLQIIRDEFSEEISLLKIQESKYKNIRGKEYPMFILTFSQAKQVLVRESKAVRKAVIKYLEELEKQLEIKTYSLPQNYAEALRELLTQVESNQKLINKIEEDKPKVIFAEALEVSKTSILIGELAKIMKQNGINTGGKRLFEWLREHSYLGTRGENYNMPTQKSMDLELMEIKKSTSVNPDGSIRTNTTPKITGKGQTYFINKFLDKNKGELKQC